MANVPIQSLIDHIKTAVDVDPWAKEMAEELLKRQEPIEPSATDSGVRIEYNCGSCGRWFCFKSKIHPEMDFRTRYCPHCGRKAKW